VVVWSHGAESEPWSSTFFTTHLASHGVVVVAAPHAGTRTGDCPDPCDVARQLELPRTRESAANRPDEVIAARDHVVTLSGAGDPILGGLVDGERTGVAGHSIGAATAIVAAGTMPVQGARRDGHRAGR
jgi:predicted dienelactone hydrolase